MTRALLETERAQVAFYLRQSGEAEAAARRALAYLEAAGVPSTANQARARQALAMAHLQRGDVAAAGEEIDRAIELYRTHRGWSPFLVSLRLDRAMVLEHQGRLEEGIRLRRELLESTSAELGGSSAAAMLQRALLGSILVVAGRFDEAEPELRRVLDDARDAGAETGENTVRNAVVALSDLLVAQGRSAEALPFAHRRRDAVLARAAAFPPHELVEARLHVARIAIEVGDAERLREARAEIAAVRRAGFDASSRHSTLLESVEARVHPAEGDLVAARRGFESALARLEANGRASSSEAGRTWLYLARTLTATGEGDAARAAFEHAHDILFRRLGADHRLTVEARRGFAAPAAVK